MSRQLSLLNRLKTQVNPDWLTFSQQACYRLIEDHWRFPERVNLCGAPGTGKTLLGWVLSYAFRADHFSTPLALRQDSSLSSQPTIIDNVPPGDVSLRTVLAELQMRNIRTAVLITEHPNALGLPIVMLPTPTGNDIDIVYRNLSLLEYYTLTPKNSGNLWEIVDSVLGGGLHES
jgi:hypothetical protein